MNKRMFMVALLISGATAFGATLKEKLAAHSDNIQTMKKNVRAGISIHAQEECGGQDNCESRSSHSENIQTMKQSARAGTLIHTQAHCGPDCRGCGE